MKFGYTITYVEDVPATVEFYEKAFGLKRLFVHESNSYAEMDTGSTKLAFASFEVGRSHGPAFSHLKKPGVILPFEIALVTDDVEGAFKTALAAGAHAVEQPAKKPWGQTVAYVADDNGYLIELCTPMG